MSRINHPISIGINDPEYYANLLYLTPCDANGHLPSNQSHLDIPEIYDMDVPLAKHQTLLDAVANISLCQKGNVSATMACLKHDKGVLETQLYIVFNNGSDEAAHRCGKHLETIFRMLGQVPYKSSPINGFHKTCHSSRIFPAEMKKEYIKICEAIHSYSFNIFEYHVNKHKEMVSKIQEYIEQDQMVFLPQEQEALVDFLHHVTTIIKVVAEAYNTRQLSPKAIQMLIDIYLYWKKHNLLLKDKSANNTSTLLNRADKWLAKALSGV